MDRITVIIGVITVVVLGGIIGSAFYQQKNFQPRNQCVEHSIGLSMHIHPEVEIIIDGEKRPIPTDIGIAPNCMKALHTHDESGQLHVEYPTPQDFKLADFFAVWGQPFNQNQILDKTADAEHKISMSVDGQPSQEFERLILKDQQKIQIKFEKKPAQ